MRPLWKINPYLKYGQFFFFMSHILRESSIIHKQNPKTLKPFYSVIFSTPLISWQIGFRKRRKAAEMAATGRAAAALLQPVTFVTGNAKKLEEVRAILGNSIPFRSLKLDRTLLHISVYVCLCLYVRI